MTMTRPRLIAASLCLLLATIAGALFHWSRMPALMMHTPASDMRTFDVQQQEISQEPVRLPAVAYEAPEQMASPPPPSPPGIAVSLPRIAYTYGYRFRLDRERIAAVQEAHLAACRRLGPALCRVTAMRRGGAGEDDPGANLKLQVAAPLAERFGQALVGIASGGGGDTADRSIAAEDLSRQMIDSEARIRTREILIQRLTALLQTRSGNIAQAVEAERAINGAQEELEAARAALADISGRVAMSAVEIDYAPRGPAPESANPIAEAFGQVGAAAMSSLGAIILIVGVALPWAALGGLIFLLVRAVRRRREGLAEPA
ncbi:MAG: DUF4349 domain-containing protein [Sphingomonadaceae bacterium]|nr:DUF4349 domain-containing protein [Sphingomonadaceae bacterium]